jgi:hypothetical protein
MLPRAGPTLFFPFMLLIGFVAMGCVAPPFRAPPQFQARVERLTAVAVIPPDVKMYSLTAGGVREEMDEWSGLARENLIRAFASYLPRNAELTFTLLKADGGLPPLRAQPTWTELDDTKALYKAVSTSILLHTYDQTGHLFPQKLRSFDYSLGPQVRGLADQANADALLFIEAMDHVSTGGRKALMVAGILMGAATGVYVGPSAGATTLSAALVDGQTGDILWYNVVASGGGHDLRNPASCAALVQQLLKDLPRP